MVQGELMGVSVRGTVSAEDAGHLRMSHERKSYFVSRGVVMRERLFGLTWR